MVNRITILVALTCFIAGMATEFMFGAFSKLSLSDDSQDISSSPFNKVNLRSSYSSNDASCDCNDNDRVVLPNHLDSGSSFIEEIIPKELQSTYAPENLQFNVTRSMIRQSRPIIGNTERLHAYINKLHSKQCTSVLFLGGSVTGGHNAKGEKNAFPRHFMDWINTRYPCRNEDGSLGEHQIKKTHAQNSQTHFIHWSMVSEIDQIDLVFIEFCVNDHYLSDIPHALEDKGPVAQNNEYIDMWYSEAIIRRLLLLRKPDPIAIVTFNAGEQSLENENLIRRSLLHTYDLNHLMCVNYFTTWDKITWENHGQPFRRIIHLKKPEQGICLEAVKNR